MKRLLSLSLTLALLLTACAPAAPQPSDSAGEPTAEEIALAILDACGRTAGDLERTDQQLDESALSAYLTNYYGLEAGSWTDCVLYRAGGAEAFEIAVLQFTQDADIDAAVSGLAAYILSREGDFTGYAPEQAEIVHNSLVAQQGAFAALLICEDAPAAKAAFDALFEDTVHPDAPPPESASVPPSVPVETTPEPSPEPSPSQVSAPPEPETPSPDPPEESPPQPEEDPSEPPERVHPTEVSEDPAEEQPSAGAVTYPGRVPYTQPGIDDMTIYDTSAIRAAWTSGDPSALSDYDRAIYDSCREIFDATITDGMSDYDKELALYRTLTGSAVYDQDHYDHFAEMDRASYTPYGPLINGKGVCLGFASAFQLFMDLCGIECIIVVGAAYNSQQDHAWNMVNLNGQWYCADPTWDLNAHGFRFFNVTSDRMASTSHQWDYDNVPEATAEDGGRP